MSGIDSHGNIHAGDGRFSGRVQQSAESAFPGGDQAASTTPADDPFVGEQADLMRAALRDVSAYMRADPHRFDLRDDFPSKAQVAQALYDSTGRWDEPELVDRIHSRLSTGAFTDEDGEHTAQSWHAFDADDRYPGKFTTYATQRGEARLEVSEGDASSFANPGYSWNAQVGQHFYSGQAATAEEAQREAVSAADYILSGRAEYEALVEMDEGAGSAPEW